MTAAPTLRFRQVHLDFHTSPLIPDVGTTFDADAFAETVQSAHIDSITCFGKCHHGWSYYPTKVGKTHPALTFDLLGAQIEACHRRDIRVPIYLTCVWDNLAADEHPDWQQQRRDGSFPGKSPGEAGWRWLCMNSPYRDYQIAQTEELLAAYDVDGFFYDILWSVHPGCFCRYCQDSMKRLGMDILNEEHQHQHRAIITRTFMETLSGVVRAKKPAATIFYNNRVKQGMRPEVPFMTHAEIEALPNGGWGYAYFPFWVRYARNFGLPTMGMTGRFHRSWADFGGLKSPDALRYECGSMLANGAVCSIGDQMHPRGTLDAAVYETIGDVYAEVEAKEAWCRDARPLTEIAILLTDWKNDSEDGAAKMLLELHHQFDILDAEADWNSYRVLVLADRGKPTPELVTRLRNYLHNGGKLLLSHEALLDSATGDFALSEEMGVHYQGRVASTPCFFKLRPNFRHGIRDFAWVMMGGGSAVTAADDTDTLADVYASYFDRTDAHFTSHFYAPHTETTGTPAVTWHRNVAYLFGTYFGDFQREGDSVYRRVVGNALDLLLPQPLLTTDAPPTTEVTVTQQATEEGTRQIVHLVNYQPNRRGRHVEVIEQMTPLRDVRVGLRLTHAPKSVTLAPEGIALAVEYHEGRAWVTVPEVRVHQMVVFETN